MKIFCLVITLLFNTFVFINAGEIIENKSYKGKKILIKYSQYGEAGEVEYTRIILQKFVQIHPNIKVEVSIYPWGQYWAKLQVQSGAGLAPDVVMLHSGVMGVWVKRGAILPLNKFIKKSEIKLSDYHKIAIDACIWDGVQYTFPLDIPTRALIYKKDKLQQSGITESEFPKVNKALTWEEFRTLAKKLTIRNNDGFFLQYGMVGGLGWDEPMFRMFGGNIFDRQINPTKTTIAGNDSLLKGMIEVYKLQYADRVHLGDATIKTGNFNVSSLLYNDKFVMAVDGPWVLRNLQKDGIAYGVTPLPIAKYPALTLDINTVGIFSGSKHPNEAWRLIKYLASYDPQIIYGKRLRGVPSLISAKQGLINNDYGAKYCEAFLYDLPTAATNIITANSYLNPIQEKWRLKLETVLNKYYDEEFYKLQKIDGVIRTKEYLDFVKKMNGFIELTIKNKLPELEMEYKDAFNKGQEKIPSYFVKYVAPLILFVILIFLTIMYVINIYKNKDKVAVINRKTNLSGFLSISPWVMGFILFLLGPILAALYFSFTDWNLINPPKWIGLQNYFDLWSDKKFLIGINRTFSYAVFVIPITVLGGLFTAGLLTNKVRGVNFFKSLFYFPSLFTGAAIAVLWTNIFNKEYGVINYLISFIGVPPINWLDENHAFFTVILMNIFWIGSSMIVYYAGMKQIPVSLYEAAEMDGAGFVKKFIHITIPSLAPVILFIVVITTIGAFQIFTPALFFTDSSATIGDPADALRFYSVNIYDEAFNNLRMGRACCYAIILFGIIFLVTSLQLKLSKRFVNQSN
ncbi:MAG: extracellular solute-binding protein [bacterium]